MAFYDKFPYTNFQELNLDYILKIVVEQNEEISKFVSLNALKYANPIQWAITRQYEKNTIVIDPSTGIAYISVKPVPLGVSVTNDEYWTEVFDLSEVMQNLQDQINANTASITQEVTDRTDADNDLRSYINEKVEAERDARASSIRNEQNIRAAMDTNLQNQINNMDTNLQNQINNLKMTYINVKKFGVKGDGSTDDTAAIQSAFNSGAGMYYFPAGKYIVSNTITLPEKVSIIGDGANATEIESKSTNADIFVLRGSYHIIESIMICTSVSRTKDYYAINTDQAVYSENITLQNVSIFRSGNRLPTGSGIHLTDQTKIWTVSNLRIESRGDAVAIKIDGGNDRFFSNCWIRGSYLAAPSLTHSGVGIEITSTQGDFFQNVDVVQFNYDLVINTRTGNVQAAKFNQCLFDSSRKHCVNIYNDRNQFMHCIDFNACWFGSAGYSESNPSDANGTAIVSYENGTIRTISFNNCQWHSNKCDGIQIVASAGSTGGIKINACTFEGNGISTVTDYNDIRIPNVNSCIITNNMFNRHSSASGNRITKHNVEVNSYSIVTGNMFHSGGENCIQNGTGNVIANNVDH